MLATATRAAPAVATYADVLRICKAATNLVVLTGAGVSTESGIPDYRSPAGSYSKGHKPMTHDEFTGSESHRRRYWARSMYGYKPFASKRPNAAHFGFAALEDAGSRALDAYVHVDAAFLRRRPCCPMTARRPKGPPSTPGRSCGPKTGTRSVASYSS